MLPRTPGSRAPKLRNDAVSGNPPWPGLNRCAACAKTAVGRIGLALLDRIIGGRFNGCESQKHLCLFFELNGSGRTVDRRTRSERDSTFLYLWRIVTTPTGRLPFSCAFPENFFNLRGGFAALILTIAGMTICGAPGAQAQTAPNNRSMAWLLASAETWLFYAGSNYDVVWLPQCNLDTYVSSSNLPELQAQVLAVASPCVPLVNNKLQAVYAAVTSDNGGCSQAPVVSLQTVQLGPWQTTSSTSPSGVIGEIDAPSGGFGGVGYQSCDTGGFFGGEVSAVIYVWICPVGQIATPPFGNCVPSLEDVSITAGSPFIPGFSIVDSSGHVLTESELTLTVTLDGQPDPGVAVPLQSDRGDEDQIDDNGVTNSGGITSASVSTRDQPGTSTITSASSDIETVQPGVITWLPAQYALPFLITCYAVAQESLDKSGPMVTMPGLQGEHHKGFVDDTNMQGTGKLLGGQFVQLGSDDLYHDRDCPLTKAGTCASTSSAAVDRRVIPKDAQIQITGVSNGDRIATDTGKKILTYHIDLFYGTSADDYTACRRFGVSPGHTVTLLSYGG